jgi:hypothetical protein
MQTVKQEAVTAKTQLSKGLMQADATRAFSACETIIECVS